MAMQIKKVAFCLETQSITSGYKLKVFFLLNICQLFASMLNLNLVTLVKSKCHPETKVKIYQNKDVQE